MYTVLEARSTVHYSVDRFLTHRFLVSKPRADLRKETLGLCLCMHSVSSLTKLQSYLWFSHQKIENKQPYFDSRGGARVVAHQWVMDHPCNERPEASEHEKI